MSIIKKQTNKKWLMEYLDFILEDDIDFFYSQDKYEDEEVIDIKIFLKQHDDEYYEKYFKM